MNLPFFYTEYLSNENAIITIDENNSRHIVSVLRMEKGEEILLTDGKGRKAKAKIVDDNRKKSKVEVIQLKEEDRRSSKVIIGISLIKNISRFEWFLEKATELGVYGIIPLICQRTITEKFRHDRMQHILISAMLQSQQCWLPVLSEPTRFETVLNENRYPNKYVAHCLPEQKTSLKEVSNSNDSLILIGPEGDFTNNEIEIALKAGCLPVTLGQTRLRTETAGIVSATLLCIH
jgi:16S rRNA (uracil1498-N3)-methyltransferase